MDALAGGDVTKWDQIFNMNLMMFYTAIKFYKEKQQYEKSRQ